MTRSVSLRAAALFGAAAILVAPALADRGQRHGDGYAYRGGSSLTLYQGEGFRGAAVTLDGPIARLPKLRFNDRASSLAVYGGAWEVCTDADFRGRCEIVTGDFGDLRRLRLNDNISSARPVGRHARRDRGNERGYDRDYAYSYAAPVVLHTDARFGGRAIPIDGAEPRLARIGANDNVSSITVTSGRWLVCSDPNFRGECEVIDGSVRNLSQWRYNDRISSIKPAGGRRHAYRGY